MGLIDNNVFSINMGLCLSIRPVKDTENESANFISLTLIAKGMIANSNWVFFRDNS